ncbi:hypothetical protein [Bacteriophage Phobos]|uniref:Neck protein n=1 Tax=Bacteriophage Phobos TaxID=2662138 RepID=A0A5Q2U8A4_9CAUD|nr:tail completion or Neck1 protein [Bacteriophage Phobos]QGH44996.1 hypothetical protein [Bacteriophage Phobos]WPK42392.1 hypothetical protein [Pseudomonas phage Ppu-503]
MQQDYVVAVAGLSSLDDINNLDEAIIANARMAINRTVDRARTASAKEMRDQIAFPARYLSGTNGRLRVSERATNTSLQATITGRDRPTSLARFATSRDPAATRRQGGVRVTVDPGKSKFMRGAFLMRLNNNNLGLAIRLKEGERVVNKTRMTRIGAGLYLLYGPSVDQVFRSVADDQAPKAADFLEAEFLRLMEL